MHYFKVSLEKTKMIVIVIKKKNLNKLKNQYNHQQKLIFLIWVDQVVVTKCNLINQVKLIITYLT